MPGMTSRTEPPREPRRVALRSDQRGFMMIEIMVSAVLLIVLALATLKLIDGSQHVSADLRAKSVAASLAENDLDRMRQMTFASAANFRTASVQRGVDNRNYTVVSTGVWTSDEGTFTSCTTSTQGNPGQYLRVTSAVSWSGMTVAPVTATSLLAPRAGEGDATNGAYVMKVQNVAGSPVTNATVTMNGRSLVTGAAGCAVFTGLPPGTYNTAYSAPGMITPTGVAAGSYSAVVTKGNTSSKVVLLDRPVTITPVDLRRESDTATPYPTWNFWSVRSGTDYTAKIGPTSSAQAQFTSSPQLFPFAAGYQVWAGDCSGENPAAYNTAFGTTFPRSGVSPAPGGSAAATVYLRTAQVKLINIPARATVRVYFKPDTTVAAMSDCTNVVAPTSPTYTNASTTATVASQTLSVDLPYGSWSYCVERVVGTTGRSAYRNTDSLDYKNMPAGGTPAPTTTPPSIDTNSTTVLSHANKCTGTGVTW
jgi:Tfp pilus assembly protein PilV